MALERYEEVVNFLVPYRNYLQKNLPQDTFRIFNCGFYIANAYEKLENEEEEYQWRLLNIEQYYDIAGHDEQWLEDYTIRFFDKCLAAQNTAQINEVGNLYLLVIETPCQNHIYVSHWLAEVAAGNGNSSLSNQHYQKVIQYGKDFPNEYQDLVEAAKTKIIR